MELTLLGTGCPSVDYKRFGPANLVSTKKTKILVDCGSGVTQRLDQAKVSSADIDALFLTHLHSDHVVDLYQLIISSWHSYRIKPWKVYGPKGTKIFIKKTMDAWKQERRQRIIEHIAHEGYPKLTEDEVNALKAITAHLYTSTKSELDKSLALYQAIDETLVSKRSG